VTDLAAPLARLIQELAHLPGVGRKTAQRLALHLLHVPRDEAESLARAIVDLRERVRLCAECFNLAEAERCPICADVRRDPTLVCVVEEPADLLSVERTGAWPGLYHVLGGALSPLRDRGPDELRVRELVERVRAGQLAEVVLATNANVEGEATAVYLSRLIRPLGVRVTRLAQGLPAGGALDYTDELTLRRAFDGRREF
jgi:recombination protein RecR